MKIGILGDTHGSAHTILAALRKFFSDDIDTIIQVGDFGFWPGKHGSTFLAYVNTLLGKNGQTMYVVPGNHEDYDQIKNFPIREDGWAVAREHILVAPRGHHWTWDGRTFLALGGAPSVDRAWRVQGQRMGQGKLWWPEEDITQEDIDKTIAVGHVDVMVAHDAPYGVLQVEKHIFGNPLGFYEDDLKYALAGRNKMAYVVDMIRPKLFFHGHYHTKIDDKLTIFNEASRRYDVVRVKGLAADGSPASQGILDLETLKFSFWYG